LANTGMVPQIAEDSTARASGPRLVAVEAAFRVSMFNGYYRWQARAEAHVIA